MDIDVTSVETSELVRAAYDLSRPQGMGFLHFTPDPLSDAEVEELVQPDGTTYLDYVRGRACKFGVWLREGRRVIRSPWYDHTNAQLLELLARVGVEAPDELTAEHGMACNCAECQQKPRAYKQADELTALGLKL